MCSDNFHSPEGRAHASPPRYPRPVIELDPDAYRAALERGATVVDTRPEPARRRRPIAAAATLTLADVQAGARPDLAVDAPIVLVCEFGQMSRLVGLYLEAEGFAHVASLAGGLRALDRSD